MTDGKLYYKRATHGHAIERPVVQPHGDLEAISQIRFLMYLNGNVQVDTTSHTSIEDGVVRYVWQEGDLVNAGAFEAEFWITYDSGAEQRVPNSGWIRIVVRELEVGEVPDQAPPPQYDAHINDTNLHPTRDATRMFHEPIVGADRSVRQPGQGPQPTVINTAAGLLFDNGSDAAYRTFKIPDNFTGDASFHVHWTKSGDQDESDRVVRWRMEYMVGDGAGNDLIGTPHVIEWTSQYDDDGSTTRIMRRTDDQSADGFIAGYYVSAKITYVPGETTLQSDPVLLTVDMMWRGEINR